MAEYITLPSSSFLESNEVERALLVPSPVHLAASPPLANAFRSPPMSRRGGRSFHAQRANASQEKIDVKWVQIGLRSEVIIGRQFDRVWSWSRKQKQLSQFVVRKGDLHSNQVVDRSSRLSERSRLWRKAWWQSFPREQDSS